MSTGIVEFLNICRNLFHCSPRKLHQRIRLKPHLLLQEAAGIRKPQIKGGKPVRKSPDKKPRLAHRHAAARVEESENKA